MVIMMMMVAMMMLMMMKVTVSAVLLGTALTQTTILYRFTI